jgi:hypothetical protein
MTRSMASALLAIFFSGAAVSASEPQVAQRTEAAQETVDPQTVPDVLVRRNGTVLPKVTGSAEDYSRHCQGCHGHLGESVVEVPRLKGRVGLFTHSPEGRAYLVQVPNVLQAHLSDARLAALLNWLLHEYSGAELPATFMPYTEAEVAVARTHRLDSVIDRRREVVDGLVRQGVVASPEIFAFSTDPGRY